MGGIGACPRRLLPHVLPRINRKRRHHWFNAVPQTETFTSDTDQRLSRRFGNRRSFAYTLLHSREGGEAVLIHVDYGPVSMQVGALYAERLGYLLGRHVDRNVDRKILRHSSPYAGAVHVHDKPGSQNSNYNLGGVLPSWYTNDLHTDAQGSRIEGNRLLVRS